MTAQESRAMFEARMKQSPAYKPELMEWTDGRYDFDIMESAYQGFMLGLEAAQAQRVPLPLSEILHFAGEHGFVRVQGNRAFHAFIEGADIAGELEAMARDIERAQGITQEKQG